MEKINLKINDLFKFENYRFLTLILIILISIILRFLWIEEIAVFGHDTVRDYVLIYKLFNYQDIIYRGPDFSIIWGFMSPIYYYTIAPFIFISNYHPLSLPIFTLCINTIALVILIYFIYRIVGYKASLIAGLFYGFSYYIILQAGYGLNPSLMPICTFLLIFSFYYILIGKINYKSIIAFGISFSLLLSYHPSGFFIVLPLMVLYFLNWKGLKIIRRYMVLFLTVISIMLIIPYAIQEKKFNYWTIKQTINYLKSSGGNESNYIESIINSIYVISNNLTSSLFLSISVFSVAIFIIILSLIIKDVYKYIKYRKNKNIEQILAIFIIIYIIQIILLIPFKDRSLYEWWFHPVYIPLVTIYISIYLSKFLNAKLIYLIGGIYLILNMYLFKNHIYEVDSYLGTRSRAEKINEYNESGFTIVGAPASSFYYDLWFRSQDLEKREQYYKYLIWGSEEKEAIFYVEFEENLSEIQIESIMKNNNLSERKEIYRDQKGSIQMLY